MATFGRSSTNQKVTVSPSSPAVRKSILQQDAEAQIASDKQVGILWLIVN